MSEIFSINAELRDKLGKGSARTLRKSGNVPINIYGSELKNVSAYITAKDATAICNKFTAKTTTLALNIGKDKYIVLPKHISVHPVTDYIEHIDLFCIKNSDKLTLEIPIKIVGKESSPGIKKGGCINVTTRTLKSRVNNDNIPAYVEVDVSQMNIGDTIKLSDITLPQHLTPVQRNTKQTIVKVVGKKAQVEEAPIVAAAATTTTTPTAEPQASTAPAAKS